MFDHKSKTYSHDNRSDETTVTKEAERRSSDRHLFTASAEVVDLSSGARFSTRTTDLGPGGCFVDTMVPFPVGVKVQVRVRKAKTALETSGVVVYSQTGLGMGIAFGSLDSTQRQALDQWLAELTGSRVTALPESKLGGAKLPSNIDPHRAALTRLVQLLVSKGILTAAEASSVFHDPVV
jgi:hypothetical protein